LVRENENHNYAFERRYNYGIYFQVVIPKEVGN